MTLKVQGAGPFTEIRLLDARFEPVALTSNTGSITVDVAPGLYEVGFREGDGWERQHVVAAPEADEVTVVQVARSLSREATLEMMPATLPQPLDDATVVVSFTGTTHGLADIATTPKITATLTGADHDTPIVPNLVPGDWRNWRFAVAPGHWRLRLSDPGERQPFELPLTVCPGYRIEIVAPLCSTGEMSIDLERLRVRLLPPDKPGAMNETLIAFEEAALTALGSGRALYGPDIEQLIDHLADDKVLNPMLGIFAAHLCDRGQDDDLPFQRRLLDKLAELTGGEAVRHPDVAALRLRLRMRNGQPIEDEPAVPFPPLLAASWVALLDAARVRPELIPAGSLSERIASRLWSSSLWMAWTAAPLEMAAPVQPRSERRAPANTPPPAEVKVAEEFTTVSEMITAGLSHPELRGWFRGARSSSGDGFEGLEWEDELHITPAEAAVARLLYPVAANEEQQHRFASVATWMKTQESKRRSSAVDLMTMCSALGLPPTTVERAVGSLARKLEAQALDFNIKL
ncbi:MULTISPECIES: hypothetical protein [unclassified Mesorhizobium]|uniref:hypothetical protein n=1 Tax=unclassified Mesorhizobium TaxID=325217 RepID=UPI0003CE8B85|nr:MULTISPECIES: hypothetical protein [unclassified Mesorhizobium]ESY55554.1 hypothetical protein X745_11850 [Mesorhizobium sp. LNJC374B00]ESY57257.1 hypothetical protein X744_19350 [Mesorhizobium sp. LNJC372A00]WJI79400.1 hypothetical protein NLY34_21320 [Mesorhizobium sp. C374B]WJI85935.1 hypothetical protein NLY42_23715 [Mesorhizobium sp. C372A]